MEPQGCAQNIILAIMVPLSLTLMAGVLKLAFRIIREGKSSHPSAECPGKVEGTLKI